MNHYEVGIQRFIEKIRVQIRLKEKEYLQIEKALIHKIVHKSPQPARTLDLRENNFLDVQQKKQHIKPKSNPSNNRATAETIENEVLPYLIQHHNMPTKNKKITLKIPTVIPDSSRKVELFEKSSLQPIFRSYTPKKWTVESSDEQGCLILHYIYSNYISNKVYSIYSMIKNNY